MDKTENCCLSSKTEEMILASLYKKVLCSCLTRPSLVISLNCYEEKLLHTDGFASPEQEKIANIAKKNEYVPNMNYRC